MPTLQEQQKSQYIQARLAYIKGECHNAVHPSVIRDRLTDVIELLEWSFFGHVSNEQPHVVPGVPVNQLDDPSRTRVTFITNAGFPPPQQQALMPSQPPTAGAPMVGSIASSPPVRSGDVNFMPGPANGAGAVGGQTVEFYAGPGQPAAAGQRVEFFGAPAVSTPAVSTPAVSSPADGGPAVSSPVVSGGGSSPPASPTPELPMTGYHPQSPIPTFSNQPQQILRHTQPTLSTEAGGPVAPVPMMLPAELPSAGPASSRLPSAGLSPYVFPPNTYGFPLNANPPVTPMEIPVNPPMNATPIATPMGIPQVTPSDVALPRTPTSNPTETTSFNPNFLIPGI
jgi:hypothetical protein